MLVADHHIERRPGIAPVPPQFGSDATFSRKVHTRHFEKARENCQEIDA